MCIENCFHSHININIYRTLYQQKKNERIISNFIRLSVCVSCALSVGIIISQETYIKNIHKLVCWLLV